MSLVKQQLKHSNNYYCIATQTGQVAKAIQVQVTKMEMFSSL